MDEWVSKKFKIVLQTYGNNIALISLEEIVDYLFREYLNGELWSIVISPNDLNIIILGVMGVTVILFAGELRMCALKQLK